MKVISTSGLTNGIRVSRKLVPKSFPIGAMLSLLCKSGAARWAGDQLMSRRSNRVPLCKHASGTHATE